MTKRSIFYIVGYSLMLALFSPRVAGAQVKWKVIQYQELDTLKDPNITVVKHGKEKLFEIRLIQDSTQPSQISMKLRGGETIYHLENKVQLTLEDIQEARCVTSSLNKPVAYILMIKCTPDGKAKFEAFTGANIGKRIGIVINNELILAPRITGKIADGIIQIPLFTSLKDGNDLAQVINDAKGKAKK